MAEESNSAQYFAPTPDITELQSPFSSWQVQSGVTRGSRTLCVAHIYLLIFVLQLKPAWISAIPRPVQFSYCGDAYTCPPSFFLRSLLPQLPVELRSLPLILISLCRLGSTRRLFFSALCTDVALGRCAKPLLHIPDGQ
jgi:hypothetical protein